MMRPIEKFENLYSSLTPSEKKELIAYIIENKMSMINEGVFAGPSGYEKRGSFAGPSGTNLGGKCPTCGR